MNKEWGELTMKVGMAAMKDREEVGAASVDYLMYSGYACLAYFWADMARLAAEKLAAGTSEEAFYTAKLQTARFYFQRILPRTRTHVATMLSGANNLMDDGRRALRPGLLSLPYRQLLRRMPPPLRAAAFAARWIKTQPTKALQFPALSRMAM